MTRENPCPECSGAGFFGDNGPLVHSLCGSLFHQMEERRMREGFGI